MAPRRVRRAAPAALLAAAACSAGDDARDGAPPGAGAVRVVAVARRGQGADAAAMRGALMAGEEGARAGDLVGRRFTVVRADAADPRGAALAAARAVDAGAIAVVGGTDAATCAALDSVAAARRVPWVNLGCDDATLRDPARHPWGFHVAPTQAMRRGTGDGDDAPVLWHAGLERYGAAQLNERYARRHSAPMDGAAWAGWMAVKALAEAALRAERADGPTVAAWLVRQDVAFDGHKGEPLRFGADDHQLRQPVYAAADTTRRGARGADAPVTTVGRPRLADRSAPLLVVTNEGSASLTVIDAGSLAVAGVVPLGHRPRGVRATHDGARVLVALSDFTPDATGDGDAIVVIDPRDGRELARHAAGSDPEQFALTPDDRYLYAANEDAGLASVSDLRTGRLLASLPVGIEPEGVAVSPDGRFVYVTAETSNTVSVIDTRRNEVVASFLVDVRPRAAAFAPDGRRAYVTNEISGTVSIVDAVRHEVLGVVPVGESAKPVGVVVSPDGRRVYVACGGTHRVVAIDPVAGRVVGSVAVGRRPWGIAMSPDGRRLFTANGASGDVSVVDALAMTVSATIPVGERPWGVTWVPGVGRAGAGL